jgi:phosphate transport system protein
MSASLERMGDLARHIAQLARMRYPELVVPEHLRPTFDEFAEQDIAISRLLTQLLDTRDLDLARDIARHNDRVNELHAGIFKAIAAPDFSGSPATAVDVALASRYFERFADHGISVSRKVTYLVTGEWTVNGDAV